MDYSKTDGKKLLDYYRNEIEKNPLLEQCLIDGCDFFFDDETDVNRDILICGEESNYDIFPFAVAGDGSNYVLLNNEYVGYISSEGDCGIIAKNVNDFYNLLFVCKNVAIYFRYGYFDNIDKFKENYDCANDFANKKVKDSKIFDEFLSKHNFKTNIESIYEMFMEGIIIEPSFILQADPKEYEPWGDIFGTNQTYINELRNKSILYKGIKKWK